MKNGRALSDTLSRPVARPRATPQALRRLGLAPLRRLQTWRTRRLAIRELERLDDYLLADIGLDRGRIRFVLDSLTDAPVPGAQGPTPATLASCLDCGVAA